MAKQCCVCGKNIGFMDGYKTLSETKEYVCSCCENLLSDYTTRLWKSDNEEEMKAIKEEAEEFIGTKRQELQNADKLHILLNEKYDERLKYFVENNVVIKANPDESAGQLTSEPDPYEELSHQLILTTAGTLEGYRITKQLGVVFGETVSKPSAGQQITSAFGDMFRALSFSAKEMKGQVGIIEEARKFAYVKMMKEAKDRGANAIIAIDSDNTIGESICYLSLYGTAVYAEKVD